MSVTEENQILEITNEEDINHINNKFNGDKKSEKLLYEKYLKIITSYINKNYFNNFNSEDDISEILIKIFNGLSKYDRQQSKFITYCYNIAKNHMIDKFRKNVLPTVPITSKFDNYHTTLSGVDNVFETNNSIDFLTQKLTNEEFNILKMKYQDGYKSAEIGDYYSVTAYTINNKISYIKTKLRKINKKL